MSELAPPPDLGARGSAYWQSVMADFDLSGSESEILLEACRTLDDLDLLDASIRREGAMVVGSTGQPVVNPALTEARGQRAILHRLLAALQLPDDDGQSVPSSGSLRSSQAAQTVRTAHQTQQRRGLRGVS